MISVSEQRMCSDRTAHEAVLVEPGGWRVTWLPGRVVGRDQATTALLLAEVLADPLDRGACPSSGRWRVTVGWAAELGLSPNQATVLIGSRRVLTAIEHRPGGHSAKNLRQAGSSSTDQSEGSVLMVATTNPDCLALGCDWDWDTERCACGASRVFRICARCLVADDPVCETCDDEAGPEVAA